MSWRKAFIIGFCVYWGICIVTFVLFVCFGLGYSFSNLANTIDEILAFPTGTGKNGNLFWSMLFWTIVLALIIKIINFYVKK